MPGSFTKNPVRVFYGVFLVGFILIATSCSKSATPTKDQSQSEQLSSSSSGQATDLPASMPDLTAGQHLKFEHISSKQGLSQNTVFCILQDNQGFMWFCTEDGLNKYDGYSFTIFRHDPEDPNSLSDSRILSIFQDRSGALWIGTANGGLNKFDRRTNQITRYQNDPDDHHSLSNNRVLSIFEDVDGALWVGTEYGLNRFVAETKNFIHYQKDSNDQKSLSGDSVQVIYQDHEGTLWFGTNEGLNRFDPDKEQFTHFQNEPDDEFSLSHNSIRAIYQDSEEALWVGTDDGLNKLQSAPERFIHFKEGINNSPGLNSSEISSIFEDSSGVLWIGTIGGGLNKLDRTTGKFTHCREKEGLPPDVILGLIDDDQGNFWLISLKGLTKFDPRTETFQNYYETDGLHFEGFTGGALIKSSGGRIYAGGLEGFIAFHSDQIHNNPYNPPIVVSKIYLDGEETLMNVPSDKITEMALEWPVNTFEFEYAALF